MLDQWIEIFKAGTHTDAGGNTRTWSESDLDSIVSKYDPANHEAPVVVGHPKDNSPAFAWVEGIKREGSVLYAKLKDIVPEFAEAVSQKLYKKRSIALYPDMSLRHLGFLGGMPPAVKGLADLSFQDDPEYMEFTDWEELTVADLFSKLREDMIATRGIEVADQILPLSRIDELKAAAVTEDMVYKPEGCDTVSPAYAEGDQDPQDQVADPDPKDVELAELRSALDLEKKKNRTIEFDLFCESLIHDGKLPPLMKSGAVEFLELVNGVTSFEFAEGEGSALDRFKSFLAALPKRLPTTEFGEGANHTEETDPKALAAKAVEYQESEKAKGNFITVSEAVNHITKKES